MSEDARAKLEPLRTELGEIDRDILALVARRQAVAQKIGQVKRDAGIPTRDYRQERDVVERARAAAVEHGLSPTLGEELILALIRGSLTVQEKDTVAASGEGTGRRALVIGGSGHMGRWFVRYLAAQGFTRRESPTRPTAGPPRRHPYHRDWRTRRARSRADRRRRADAGDRRDPRGDGRSAAEGHRVRRRLAEEPAARRPRARCARPAASVTSVHPMFGPDTELLSGRHVIFVDLGVPEATAAARALFEPTMATLVEMDLESHDRLIAYVLGLSHALNIAFFTALAESGEAAPRLATLSSTTFDAQLGVAAKVAAREPRSLLRDPDAQRLRHRVARGAALRRRAAALGRARERPRGLPRADDARQGVPAPSATPLDRIVLRAEPVERVADRGLERTVRVAELARAPSSTRTGTCRCTRSGSGSS